MRRRSNAYRVTWLTSVPTMLALVARKSATDRRPRFFIRHNVTMGSAPLTQALVDKVQAMFPKAAITNSYGTTEGGPSPFGPHPRRPAAPGHGMGYPVPGSQAELREGPGPDEGVLYMTSPMLMEGYNNLPTKTADVMHRRLVSLRRHHAARRKRFFYFVGRADDMFVVGGENVWPGEVEKLIERMAGVHQAAVVPVPDEIKGALPFAFVVRQPGSTASEAEIKAFAIANGPAFAHPRFVEFCDVIPLAATNKPDRKRLTAMAEAQASRRRAAGERQ